MADDKERVIGQGQDAQGRPFYLLTAAIQPEVLFLQFNGTVIPFTRDQCGELALVLGFFNFIGDLPQPMEEE